MNGENFILVQFAEAKQPEYREKKKEGYMEYGEKNDYPLYLVELFNKSAKHNAIVRNKVHYICGNGWTGNEQFIEKPNRSENLTTQRLELIKITRSFGIKRTGKTIKKS